MTRRPRGSRVAVLLLALVLVGCARELPPLPPAPMVPHPDPAEVETVVFFVGDPGEARIRSHPILHALKSDVEWWAEALGRDTSVAVVILGDMVYPEGLRPREHPAFEDDSLHVFSQVRLVDGEAARQWAHVFFVAGNHDWGREQHWEGRDRLNNLDRLLIAYRERGLPVSLEPPPGEGGPTVVDLGRHLRILLIDSAWWLLGSADEEREELLLEMEEAVLGAGDRSVVYASHHPYRSAGAHGGYVPIWEAFGVRPVLARSGAILQDLNSRPYRQLRNGIRRIGMHHGPVLLHVGGHDHSLQVIESGLDGSPSYSVVSGSASKLTEVGHVEGMLMRRAWPGYAILFALRDGGVILSMEAAPPRFLACEDGDGREACMARGAGAYRTIWSDRIR